MRFVVVYPVKRNISTTGGQKYEDNLWLNFKKLDYETDYIALNKRSLRISRIFSPIKSLFILKKLFRYDAIFFNSTTFFYFLPLTAILKLFGKKVFIVHHHFLYLGLYGLRRLIYKWAEILFLKSSTYIISPSPYIKNELFKIRLYNTILWKIPFDRKSNEVELVPIPGNLLFIGTIEERKGIHLLLESLSKLKNRNLNFNLNIIGKTVDNEYERRLKNYVYVNNLPVKFWGLVSTEEKEEIMRISDIFVFPSLLEGFGMVLAEAQCYGLPIVCFDNSAMPLTVQHNKNGLLCKNKDTDEMAQNIARILLDRSLRLKFSQQSLRDSEKLSTNENLKDQIYNDLNFIFNIQ